MISAPSCSLAAGTMMREASARVEATRLGRCGQGSASRSTRNRPGLLAGSQLRRTPEASARLVFGQPRRLPSRLPPPHGDLSAAADDEGPCDRLTAASGSSIRVRKSRSDGARRSVIAQRPAFTRRDRRPGAIGPRLRGTRGTGAPDTELSVTRGGAPCLPRKAGAASRSADARRRRKAGPSLRAVEPDRPIVVG
jgi:hypothetical protein